MPKLKTNKAVAKRFLVKRSKKGIKVMKRVDGQDHFNAREGGKVGRNKRRDIVMSTTVQNTILKAMPYA